MNKSDINYFLKTAPLLFGRYWKTNCAKCFGKTLNTILNWRKGKTPVPKNVITLLEFYEQKNMVFDTKTQSMKVKKNVRKPSK